MIMTDMIICTVYTTIVQLSNVQQFIETKGVEMTRTIFSLSQVFLLGCEIRLRCNLLGREQFLEVTTNFQISYNPAGWEQANRKYILFYFQQNILVLTLFVNYLCPAMCLSNRQLLNSDIFSTFDLFFQNVHKRISLRRTFESKLDCSCVGI